MGLLPSSVNEAQPKLGSDSPEVHELLYCIPPRAQGPSMQTSLYEQSSGALAWAGGGEGLGGDCTGGGDVLGCSTDLSVRSPLKCHPWWASSAWQSHTGRHIVEAFKHANAFQHPKEGRGIGSALCVLKTLGHGVAWPVVSLMHDMPCCTCRVRHKCTGCSTK